MSVISFLKVEELNSMPVDKVVIIGRTGVNLSEIGLLTVYLADRIDIFPSGIKSPDLITF
jgi:hypothetical protein